MSNKTIPPKPKDISIKIGQEEEEAFGQLPYDSTAQAKKYNYEYNNTIHNITVIGTYVYGLLFIILPHVIILIWIYHLLLPEDWYWLSKSQLQVIQNRVFGVGGIGIGILHSYIGSQFFNKTKH